MSGNNIYFFLNKGDRKRLQAQMEEYKFEGSDHQYAKRLALEALSNREVTKEA